MHAAIHQVKAKTGKADELAERIKVLPHHQRSADTVTAISIFNTVAEAQESIRRALAWIDEISDPGHRLATATAGPVTVHWLP